MSNELWIIAEHADGKLKKISRMTLSVGRELAKAGGKKICAVLLAAGAEQLICELADAGAQKIYAAQDPGLEHYGTEAYTAVLAEIARREKPGLILLGHSSLGKDLAPRLAERLGAALVSDCVGIEGSGEDLLFKRPVYAGKAFAWLAAEGSPVLVSLRPNAFAVEKPAPADPEIIHIKNPLAGVGIRALVKELVARVSARAPLAEADIVISGGRGMKSPENFALIEELADVLGAAVGASRAVVDAGWRDYAEQVGQTGKVVSPSVYFAFGISGALQHIAGMSSSKVIVAVNKDPEAAIFKTADYGIVADAMEVLPILTAELEKALA